MTSIVFSKNRATQLNAFLRSYRDHLIPLGKIHVLYSATSPEHYQAYQDVFARHDFAIPNDQTPLKETILGLLPQIGTVIFYVDDQVFVRPWRVEKLAGLSLRLAPHLTHCYSMGMSQSLPELMPETIETLSWRWGQGHLDWGYPLSLDGHVFDAEELRGFVQQIEFHSPNTFEAALQRFTPLFADRKGYCYMESKVVNIPLNIVQSDWSNRHSDHMCAEALLTCWREGFEIDVWELYNVKNRSAHQDFQVSLIPR